MWIKISNSIKVFTAWAEESISSQHCRWMLNGIHKTNLRTFIDTCDKWKWHVRSIFSVEREEKALKLYNVLRFSQLQVVKVGSSRDTSSGCRFDWHFNSSTKVSWSINAREKRELLRVDMSSIDPIQSAPAKWLSSVRELGNWWIFSHDKKFSCCGSVPLRTFWQFTVWSFNYFFLHSESECWQTVWCRGRLLLWRWLNL